MINFKDKNNLINLLSFLVCLCFPVCGCSL